MGHVLHIIWLTITNLACFVTLLLLAECVKDVGPRLNIKTVILNKKNTSGAKNI